MNGQQFNDALDKNKRGDALAYHVGLLMRDRCFNVDTEAVAQAAWRAAEEGRCVLVQRRVSPTACQYLAVKVRDASKSAK